MSKLFRTLLWGGAVLTSLLVAGCAKEYDDSELRGKISDLDSRLTALEKTVKTLNEQTVPGIQTIVTALQANVSVTDVKDNGDGSYTISFSNGKTATLSKGDKGDKGDEGPSPSISCAEVDGIYYWTVNGEFMKDANNNKVPVTGENGKTPIFRNNTDGLEYSIDGGESWTPVPIAEGSKPAVSFAETDTSIIFSFANGSTYEVAKELAFSLKFDIPDGFTIMVGETGYINYALEGVFTDDVTEVGILTTTPGFSAEAEPSSNKAGKIAITNESENANATHKVYVFAANGKGKTDIKGLSFASATLQAVLSVQMVSADGGDNVVLNVKANEDYDIELSDGADAWLTVTPPTRALYEDALAVTIAANETNEYRYATITLKSKEAGEILDVVDVLQAPVATEATSLASLVVLPDDTKVTVYNVSTIAANDKKAIITDDGQSALYVVADGLYPEGVFDITGIKETDESGLTYLEVTALQIKMDQEPVVLDPHEYYTYYGMAANGAYYMFTVANGILSKDGDAYIVPGYEEPQQFVIYDAPAELGLDAMVGKLVAIKGWIAGCDLEDGKEDIELILSSAKAITFTQEPAWSISYSQDGGDIITITSSTKDAYVPKYALKSDILEDYSSFEEYLPDAAYYASDDVLFNIFFYGYWGDSFEEAYDECVYSGDIEGDLGLDEYGVYYAYMIGIDEDGAINGKYAMIEFEKVDPHVPAEYSEFIGDFEVGNDTWTISENENGKSYFVTGVNGYTTLACNALFQDGKFVLMETSLGAMDDYDEVAVIGDFYYYGSDYLGYGVTYDEPAPLLTVGKLDDGTFDVTPGTIELYGDDYSFNYILFIGFADGDYDELDFMKMPASFAKGIEIVDVPVVYEEDFEDAEGPAGWTFIDADGDGFNWQFNLIDPEGDQANYCKVHGEGAGSIVSYSYDNDTESALTPDNWAISPEITFTADNHVVFYYIGQDPSWAAEKLGVYVVTEPTADGIASAVQIGSEVTASGNWQTFVGPIPGGFIKGHIAIRHFDSSDEFAIVVDDFAVVEGDPTAAAAPAAAPSRFVPAHQVAPLKLLRRASNEKVPSAAAAVSENNVKIAAPFHKGFFTTGAHKIAR